METNLYCCTLTGHMISEKTMEDGNIVNTKDDKVASASLANLYSERSGKVTANGHDFAGECSSPLDETYTQYRPNINTLQDDKSKKRINPLRIHLGKRLFVDNTLHYSSANKKRKLYVNKPCESNALPRHTVPIVPKLIPKHIKRNIYPNVESQVDNNAVDDEKNKPVPRLVPKHLLTQFKKSKAEKGAQLKEYAQNLGLQPMVKFKCRKCCSMSFKTLAMLKEHQLVCRVQSKEPALSPVAAPSPVEAAGNGGPSRVTRKVYLCSACGTYYENWNLFLHMREIHNRHICLFCLGMFSKADKLSSHLANKHNVYECSYDNKDEFLSVYNGTMYLMCCLCDEICTEQDDFFNHDCNKVIPRPVPVLVNKNAAKPNSIKVIRNGNEFSINGPPTKDLKPVCEQKNDKKDISEIKPETVIAQSSKISAELNNSTTISTDTSISSEKVTSTSKDSSSIGYLGTELDSSEPKQVLRQSSPTHISSERTELPNGGDEISNSDRSDASDSDDHHALIIEDNPTKSEELSCPPAEKEKECGIKLKLSLNNANSPVIINSTVDPTVGKQNLHKPPSRVRRPPKRYEKDPPKESAIQPRTPTIKMTICDKADSPFVKTTIFENDQENTLKTLLNNNLESTPKIPEPKVENTVKTTIYDNNLDDMNTLNRVPKLTVRVPKELLDKDSSSDYSSDSDVSDKLTVDENKTQIDEVKEIKEEPKNTQELQPEPQVPLQETVEQEVPPPPLEEKVQADENINLKLEPKTEMTDQDTVIEPKAEEGAVTDEIPVTELTLDKPLDKYPLKDLLKVFLSNTIYNCIYCNHVRKIAVDCENLSLHMVAQHRFSATVDSITAEELMPETIIAKVKQGAEELREVYINMDSYDSVEKCENIQYDHVFECFQCYFKTAIHKDLYLHNRKMHQKTIMLCVMCKTNFYSYSELLCHLCPGTYDSEYDIKFRCCLCSVDSIPSSFRLMVHLRKIHHTCDVCLEFCYNQSRLSNHVWKHKLHHICYRCGIAYRNKPDITKHLFWKHGTESVMCKKCLQKKWPHVYHFCIPPAIFVCDECSAQFTKAVCLKVHKRLHTEEFPHACTEEGCTEKFVSKKLLTKHMDEHRKKLVTEDLSEEKPASEQAPAETAKDPIPIINLVDDDKPKEEIKPENKSELGTEQVSKKVKKKRLKDKDALLLDVNLPALNLSESDSSDESDSGLPPPGKEETLDQKEEHKSDVTETSNANVETTVSKSEDKTEALDEEKPDEKQVLEIWDNFKKYQANVEKQKEKTPPLVPIRKHVCESDHDYCLIPTDVNGDEDSFNPDKKKNKKSLKKKRGDFSSSSSSSSDSDSSCSCGSNCSCSSSSGSSSSSSSDSDSSDLSGNKRKKNKQAKKALANRRMSNGSNVDVMGMSETPILIPEKNEPTIAETDLETDESETDEEFYDKCPQNLANKLTEKRNLMLLSSVAPSDGGSVSGEASRCTTPIKEEKEPKQSEIKGKPSSSKKKSKKKKKSKSSKKHGPIKINIPKDIIAKSEIDTAPPPNKITISLQTNTVQMPEAPKPPIVVATTNTPVAKTIENKRASKRRRVPNKFYGYSSDEETTPTTTAAFKPQQPPKLEWRKEDLPSPVTPKVKKEVPSSTISHRLYNYTEPIRLKAPIPDPEPPRFLMNSESMDESSDSDSSEEGALQIDQANTTQSTLSAPTYLNSGTSSLPYPFQRPAIRQAREGESVYCYCRCPYDEVSEMIACDAEGCPIEWFHFECVGIMVPPKGKWYCPECRKNQNFSGYR